LKADATELHERGVLDSDFGPLMKHLNQARKDAWCEGEEQQPIRVSKTCSLMSRPWSPKPSWSRWFHAWSARFTISTFSCDIARAVSRSSQQLLTLSGRTDASGGDA
jgi:hypothetical protein